MGERTTGIEDPALLELQIEAIRRNLTGIVRELDHRRHDLTDVRGQITKHKREIIAAGSVVAVVAGAVGVAAFVIHRRNRRLDVRAKNLRKAIGRILEDPNRLARPEPSILKKVATALIAGSATAAIKTLASTYLAEVKGKPKALEPWQALNPPQLTR